MREIKFRAWDKQKKEFNCSPFLKTGDDKNDWIVFLNQQAQPRQGGDLVFNLPYSRQQFELMQYTGFHDKAGKEIYEGDIVCSLFRRKDEEIYEVKWITKSAEFSIQNQAICERDIEVIGNIYENPELLKGA